MRSTTKHLFFWLVAALVVFLFWSISTRINTNERTLSFSDFMVQLERGHVERVTVSGGRGGSEIVGVFKNGQTFRTFAPQTESLVEVMMSHGVDVRARDPNEASWVGHLISWTPIVVMIAFLIFFMRGMQSSAPRVSPVVRLRERQERRLEMKVRFFEALAAAKDDLFEDELLPLAASGSDAPPDETRNEARKALYEMLRDGTAEITPEKKYRLRTRP